MSTTTQSGRCPHTQPRPLLCLPPASLRVSKRLHLRNCSIALPGGAHWPQPDQPSLRRKRRPCLHSIDQRQTAFPVV